MNASGVRRFRQLVVFLAAGLILGGCGLIGGHKNNDATPVADQVSAPVTDEPTTEAPPPPPPPTTKPTPKKTTKPTKKPSSAAPTEDPFWEQLPACAHKDKTKPVSKSKVKAALKSASGRVYWTHEAPQLKLNYTLVKGVSYMESGWQSNIHNCDGGTGIMQVMPDTVSFINQRFGLDYDASDYKQNAQVGANYLAYLTRHAGDLYFGGKYDLSTSKCKTTTSWCLLNVVISGYNAGQGSIEQDGATKSLPNPQYVSTVRALMTRCKCDQY
jgi:soluble lytic murein transglycosylase-like protein